MSLFDFDKNPEKMSERELRIEVVHRRAQLEEIDAQMMNVKEDDNWRYWVNTVISICRRGVDGN